MGITHNSHIALFSDTFSSHVKFHYLHQSEKEKQQKLLSRISSLQLFTASYTLSLIQQSLTTVSDFSELVIHNNAFSCNICKQVLLNMKNMKKHCTKDHASDFKHTITSFVTA